MNYIIESNIDFYAELNKELNKELNDNSNNVEECNNTNTNPNGYNNYCLLTNNNLQDNYITLDCSHCFNYIPLYNEITSQKNYNYLETTHLLLNQIKCPYCRSITDKLIPYIPYEDVLCKRGVNYPSKYCMRLFSCDWTNKSGKNKNNKCCRDAYKLSTGIYCSLHHNSIENQSKKQINIDKIVWSERHEELNKHYKLVELKKILKDNNKLIGGTKKQVIDRIINCKVNTDKLEQ